ncbi:hypothetical protein P7C71_g4138, partial [Lecanoromycetidae sp. Uapishka_2]
MFPSSSTTLLLAICATPLDGNLKRGIVPGYTVPQNYIDYFLADNLYPEVCGESSEATAAAQTRTTALWNFYNITALYQEITKDYQGYNWISQADNTSQFENIQDLILELAGPEDFFTPQVAPTGLIVPFGILNGLATLVSLAWGPAGALSGIATITNAILTQAGLDAPNPLIQWSAIQVVLGETFTDILSAYEWLYNHTLLSLPAAGSTGYETDPTETPTIFASGLFAQPQTIGVFDPSIYGPLTASAINTLWIEDGVFILKISDTSYGKGAGAACQAYPLLTVCINGVAYLWLRWKFDGGDWDLQDEDEPEGQYLDTTQWAVWGAYNSGGKNAERLSNFSLDLPTLTDSAVKTFTQYGFPFTGQDAATVAFLESNPTDITTADFLYFSVPVCDMDAILGGKHLGTPYNDGSGTEPIARYGACTCVQAASWPITNTTYALPDDPISTEDCIWVS